MDAKFILIILISLLVAVFIAHFILCAFMPYKPPKSIVCAAHMHQLSVCLALYNQEYHSWPSKEKWCDLLMKYISEGEKEYLICPEEGVGPCSYAMNENIPDNAETLPDDLVLIFESKPGWNQFGGPDDVVIDRHGEQGTKIMFSNGISEFFKAEDIPNLRWTVEEEEHD